MASHPVVYDRYGFTPATTGYTVDHAESALAQIVADLQLAHPAIAIAGDVVYGAAERVLADASDSASMVVVGSRGHTAMGEAFLGSVSAGVLHKAHCPVAVIH